MARTGTAGLPWAAWPRSSAAPIIRKCPRLWGWPPAWKADVYESGYLGSSYDPLKGLELVGKFGLPEGIAIDRLRDRSELRGAFDRFRTGLDRSEMLTKTDASTRAAYEMVASGYVQNAFDLSKEQDSLRDHYGRNSVGEKALLARRLVEAGVSYVLVSGAWGYFDHHGDDVPPWGGHREGAQTTAAAGGSGAVRVGDGPRTARTAGRHAGGDDGGIRPCSDAQQGSGPRPLDKRDVAGHGGGGTPARTSHRCDRFEGGGIQHGAVRPQDLAATVFRHLEIDLRSEWINPQGRPMPIVVEGGRPIPELFSGVA